MDANNSLKVEGVTNTPPRRPTSSNSYSGRISPSVVCFQRKMSAAIVTHRDADHKLLGRRSKVAIEKKQHVTSQTLALTECTISNLIPKSQIPPIVRRASTVPTANQVPGYLLFPSPLRLEHWTEPAANSFHVRGPNYLQNGVKIHSEACIFQLLTVDLIQVKQPVMSGLCNLPDERIQCALERERKSGIMELPPFVFCVNYCIPTTNTIFPYFHWVAYFGLNDVSLLRDQSKPLGRLANAFFFGSSDEFRNNTFKLIPRIVEGNFVVRKAVGSKPSILGRKLKQVYVRNDRYFEVIIDISSDSIAERIVKLAIGTAKSLIVDMMFVLEGNDASMLPERILAGVRMQHLDFNRPSLQRTLKPP